MYDIKIDYTRNNEFTDFAQATLEDRYLLEGETPQDAFARVARTYADDADHAQRLYDYLSKKYFIPATPVLANGGANRALPISCFLSEVQDDMHSIVNKWNESVWIAANTGGTGTYWGNIRAIGEKIGAKGKASGVVPFIVVQNSLSSAIDRGAQRRGAGAVYLPVWHPEIQEFIKIRQPTGGDPMRKALFLHNAVVIDDAFMQAVEKDEEYALRSPKTGETVKMVRARDVWIELLVTRVETGEPYILYIDTVLRAMPEYQKKQGLTVKMSNLCSEIVLPTGLDQYGKDRTAVCCLSSVNLEKYEEWSQEPQFIEDMMRYLDNILQDFIDRAPDEFEAARYSAMRERAVGLGTLGFHSFLQKKRIPFESSLAKAWNLKMFKYIKQQADAASVKLAEERGPCPDAAEALVKERFSHKIAVAPNGSSSIIIGSSASIEPIPSNCYNHKTLSGTFRVRNHFLEDLLAEKGFNDEDTWTSIMVNGGSVQHLDFLTDDEKDVFKTAFEIDQRWVIEHAGDRAGYICQSQSLNIFVPADVHKRDLHMLHYLAWKKGVKSLYYCRSKSLQRAEVVSIDKNKKAPLQVKAKPAEDDQDKYAECLACQ